MNEGEDIGERGHNFRSNNRTQGASSYTHNLHHHCYHHYRVSISIAHGVLYGHMSIRSNQINTTSYN